MACTSRKLSRAFEYGFSLRGGECLGRYCASIPPRPALPGTLTMPACASASPKQTTSRWPEREVQVHGPPADQRQSIGWQRGRCVCRL